MNGYSSKEGLTIAYDVQTNLEYNVHGTVWPQGVFGLSESPLDSLLNVLSLSDFGIFIFSPDDVVKMRNEEHHKVRDNVLFELGLFIGKLGKQRCFIVMPDEPKVTLPSDLAGVTPATFNSTRDDSAAAVGPACHKIREAIQKHGFYSGKESNENIPINEYDNYDEGDKRTLLEDFIENNPDEGPHKFTDIDHKLGLEPGTAKKYMAIIIAGKPDFKIKSQGSNLISFTFSPNIY